MMTPPRQNLAGASYLVTRRCSERRFLLRPDGFVVRALLFILGYAATWYGIQIHAVAQMSNHWHLVITDLRGRKSDCFRFVHSMITRSVNAFRGRFEALWAPGRPNFTRLLTPEDVLDRMVYCMLNPVRAGLVDRAAEWPGLISLPEQIGGAALTTTRPRRFFSVRGALGSVSSLRYVRPPGFEHLSDEELRALLAERLEAGEQALREGRAGKPVLGAAKVLKQHWNSRPKSRAPRFGRVPHIACRDTAKRVQALADRARFIAEYRRALKRFRGGARNVLFPYGTLMMRQRFRVRCHKAPPNCVLPSTRPPPDADKGAETVPPTPRALDDYSDF
jgi:REP element-mobilizing transposase RayT